MRRLLVVTGPPGAGKTSLARPLAKSLSVPLIEKDAIKEVLFDTVGYGSRELSKNLSEASYGVMFHLARSLPAGILEANFRPAHATRLRELAQSPLQIVCRCPFETLQQRLAERERHPGHLPPDEEVMATMREITPLQLHGPILEVDTSRPVDIDEVATWVGTQDAWTRDR